MRKIMLGLLLGAAASATPAWGQDVPEATVTVYRAVPGHQEELLRWLARQDEYARAAGVAPAQLYVHQNGAAWDYMIIAPDTTDAQDEAIEAAQRAANAPAGPRIGLELRQHINWHEDTLTAGPTTAADWLRRLGPPAQAAAAGERGAGR